MSLEQVIQQGETLYQQQQYVQAFPYVKQAAEAGHVASQRRLGVYYQFGRGGVSVNVSLAAHYYELAANRGDVIAQNNLAQLYQEGKGIPKDLQKAAQLYMAASAKGLATATANLGFLYDSVGPLPTDYNKAFRYYTLAMSQGDILPNIKNNLAVLYMNGRGTSVDYYEAEKLFKEAIAAGDKQAEINYSLLRKRMKKGEHETSSTPATKRLTNAMVTMLMLALVVLVMALFGGTAGLGVGCALWLLIGAILFTRAFHGILKESTEKKFFEECRLAGITDLKTPENLQAAMKIMCTVKKGKRVTEKQVRHVFEKLAVDREKEIIAAETERAEDERQLKEREPEEAVAFYLYCVEQGCADPKNSDECEKIERLVRTVDYARGRNGVELFARGKQLHEEQKRKQKEAEAQARRQALAKKLLDSQEAEARVQAMVPGQVRRELLRKELEFKKSCLARSTQELEALEKEMETGIVNPSLEKKHDWAIHGGLASAVGGSLFGAVTAVSVQQENQQIDERNRNRMRLSMNLNALRAMEYEPKIKAAKERVATYKKQSEEAETALKHAATWLFDMNIPPESLMQLIVITGASARHVSENIHCVSAKLELSSQPFVGGQLRAVLCGSVKADVFRDGEKIATVCCLLPPEGIRFSDKKSKTITGYFQIPAIPKATYSIEWHPHRLWLEEE